jgi:hypothetical protein
MSTETQETQEMGTKPVAEHAWLQKLVGEWKISCEMGMPDGSIETSQSHASCKSLGGLWAFSKAEDTMPNGEPIEIYRTLGYDVSFKEYRGCMFMSASSHLWKYAGTLSEDGKTMTLDCEGPDMVEDGKTALYREVIELIDADTYTVTTYGQDEKGEWQQFMKSTYTRV